MQPNAATLTKNSATLQHFTYAYGQIDQTNGVVDANKNNGQVARIDSYIGGTAEANRQWQQRFSYDTLGRLEVFGEYATTGAQTPVYRGHYGYDPYGNRYQSAAQTQNLNISYTPVAASDVDTATNRLISGGTSPVTYDPAGNVTVDNRFRFMQYAYDANNRMLSANRGDGSSYTSSIYDGGGQRLQTTSNGYTRAFVYDVFGSVIAEYGNGVLEREYVYRGGHAIATIEAAAACYKTVEQFIRDFYQGGLGRAVNEQTELPYWKDRLTKAQAQGQAQLLSEAKALGNAIFAPDEQTYRARTDSEFVADLYRGYLQREPDQGGWTAWTNALQTNTRAVVRGGFSNSSEFANNVRRLCVSVPLSGVNYLTADFQGSVRVVTNEQGVVVARHDYQPFGEEVWAGTGSRTAQQMYGATDQIRERYAYTQRDDMTGLEHTWFRKYERGGGRWTSPDPYGGSMSIGDPQSLNRYAYVQNDPVNFVDPSGLNMCSAEFSYERCGGNDGFWSDGGWGNWFAQYGGMSQAEYDYEQRLISTLARNGHRFVIPERGVTTSFDNRIPRVRNATPAQQNRFDEAYTEVLERLKNSKCADFFGGLKKALEALSKTKFSFGSPSSADAAAESKGNKVIIDPNSYFSNTSGSTTIDVGFNMKAGSILSITIGNVEAAAFLLLHELGHRTKSFGEFDNDAGIQSTLNNETIREACFSEVTPSARPIASKP